MSDPKPTGDDAAQAGDQPSRPDEWIGFEAAAKLIDGPDGWWYDHAKQNRPRAEALLHLAYLGRVRLKAASWSVQARKEAGHEPTAEEMSAFAQMLLAREKAHKDTFSHPPFMGETVRTSFRIADDRSGHFDVMHVVTKQGQRGAQATRHEVVGLRFHRSDIVQLFDLLPDTASNTDPTSGARAGRPPAQWWPEFAEELAVYIHDIGLPAGSGAQGQSKMIDDIFERLATSGRSEPSRTSVQPVISRVLKRLRSAGN